VTPLAELQSFTPEPVEATPAHANEQNDVITLATLAEKGGPGSIEAIARLARMAVSGGSDRIDPTDLVEGLLALRVSARDSKDFALADRIRDVLVTSGIEVKDGVDGSTWSIK
jgi:cysteinyl-tRNA synthetase